MAPRETTTPPGDVNPITKNIAVLDNHVADVDADPVGELSITWRARAAPRKPALNANRGHDSVGDAWKLDQ